MIKQGKIVLSMTLLSGILLIMGCSKKEAAEENSEKNVSKTQVSETDDTHTEEDETMGKTDMTDGDLSYPVPDGYRARKGTVEYGSVITVRYESSTVGKKRDVTIVLPAGYTESKKYPVLYMCHGLGQDNTQWTNEGHSDIVIGNMIASGEASEMILVLPNCRARMDDRANPQDAFVITNYVAFDNFINEFQNDLKPFIEANYSVASGRENTGIAGFSMGGRVALHLGFTLQDTFGYVGAFCPAPGVFGYTMMGVTEEGLFEKDEFKIKDEYKNDTFVMIVGGKSDNVVGGHPESYHNVLTENNVNHIWYKASGGHDFNVVNYGLYNFVKNIFKNNK